MSAPEPTLNRTQRIVVAALILLLGLLGAIGIGVRLKLRRQNYYQFGINLQRLGCVDDGCRAELIPLNGRLERLLRPPGNQEPASSCTNIDSDIAALECLAVLVQSPLDSVQIGAPANTSLSLWLARSRAQYEYLAFAGPLAALAAEDQKFCSLVDCQAIPPPRTSHPPTPADWRRFWRSHDALQQLVSAGESSRSAELQQQSLKCRASALGIQRLPLLPSCGALRTAMIDIERIRAALLSVAPELRCDETTINALLTKIASPGMSWTAKRHQEKLQLHAQELVAPANKRIRALHLETSVLASKQCPSPSQTKENPPQQLP